MGKDLGFVDERAMPNAMGKVEKSEVFGPRDFFRIENSVFVRLLQTVFRRNVTGGWVITISETWIFLCMPFLTNVFFEGLQWYQVNKFFSIVCVINALLYSFQNNWSSRILAVRINKTLTFICVNYIKILQHSWLSHDVFYTPESKNFLRNELRRSFFFAIKRCRLGKSI